MRLMVGKCLYHFQDAYNRQTMYAANEISILQLITGNVAILNELNEFHLIERSNEKRYMHSLSSSSSS